MMRDLQRLVKEARSASDEIRGLFEEAREKQGTLHSLIIDRLLISDSLLKSNIRANAELFNAAMNHTERDLRLELDRFYRLQRDTIRQLLDFPPG